MLGLLPQTPTKYEWLFLSPYFPVSYNKDLLNAKYQPLDSSGSKTMTYFVHNLAVSNRFSCFWSQNSEYCRGTQKPPARVVKRNEVSRNEFWKHKSSLQPFQASSTIWKKIISSLVGICVIYKATYFAQTFKLHGILFLIYSQWSKFLLCFPCCVIKLCFISNRIQFLTSRTLK